MEKIGLMFFMMIIGAIIGGLTNSLAIKMLFRPHRVIYIGRFRLPFTPGLIPKRQKELARQLGRTVVNHLLTPEGVKRKIQNHPFRKQLESWTVREMNRILQSSVTLQDVFHRFQVDLDEEKLKNKSLVYLERKWQNIFRMIQEQKLGDVLPTEISNKVENMIPQISHHLLHQLDVYLKSYEGREAIGAVAEEFLASQGFLGNMVSSFLGKEGLSEKIQPAISGYLRSEKAQNLVCRLLKTEWDKLLNRKVKDTAEWIDITDASRRIMKGIVNEIPYKTWLHTPIRQVVKPYQGILENQVIPDMISMFVAYITNKMDQIMKNLHIHDIVQNEVEHFDMARLEQMVLDISRREFKMITYLGALIGGIIGFVQGMVVILIS